jgi:anti-sigma regulatory factor (Ser/Thr protein kinase)
VLVDYAELRSLRASLRQALETPAARPGKEMDDVAERMAIVATELATNALNHAHSAAVVRLSRTKAAFILDVADDLPSASPQVVPRLPAAVRGRGMHITTQLANDAGWYIADGNKHVWARFVVSRRGRRFPLPRISVFDLQTWVRLLRRIGT